MLIGLTYKVMPNRFFVAWDTGAIAAVRARSRSFSTSCGLISSTCDTATQAAFRRPLHNGVLKPQHNKVTAVRSTEWGG